MRDEPADKQEDLIGHFYCAKLDLGSVSKEQVAMNFRTKGTQLKPAQWRPPYAAL
jgi:hypothetical protein